MRSSLVILSLLIGLGAAVGPGSATGADECSRPYPVNLPEAPPSEQDAMLELQGKVKDYLAKANAYLECNEEEQRSLAQALDDEAAADEAQVQIQILLTRYNNTVDEMHVVGDRYNALVRAFNGQGDTEDPSS